MIEGKNRNNSEKSYREIFLDSSSSLKDFSLDRRKYHKKYILNESVEEEDTLASKMGKLVETLLLEEEKFDEKFHISACAVAPSGLMLKFVESLYSIFKENTDEEGNVTKEFSEMLKEAYIRSGYKISFERVIKDFEGGDNEIYFNEILRVRTKGLIVVTPSDIANAEKIVNELKTNPITADIVNLVSSSRYTVYTQCQVEDFEIDGLPMKAMMDLVHIDHFKKTILVYDLKTVWAVETFMKEYYLYRRAYIQAYTYYQAAKKLAEQLEDETGEEYEVLPIKFIVCDSINYYSPLIYELSDYNIAEAYTGFEYKGYDYPGVQNIIKDLKWTLKNNIWNISRENYENLGRVKLK